MCLSAIHWSKIDRVVFGATIADAAAAGFCELHVAAAMLAEMGRARSRSRRAAPRGMCGPLRHGRGRALRDAIDHDAVRRECDAIDDSSDRHDRAPRRIGVALGQEPGDLL